MVFKPSVPAKLIIPVITLLFIPLLFFNVGIILSERWAYLGGWYSNYYQVRITLATVIALIVVVGHRQAWKYLLLTAPLWITHFWLHPEPQLLIRVWKAAIFMIQGGAFVYSLREWTSVSSIPRSRKVLIASTVLLFEAVVMTIQLLTQRGIPGIQVLGQPTIPSPGGAQETLLNQFIPSINQFSLPYGTVPHPNIAAGIALLLIILIMAQKRNQSAIARIGIGAGILIVCLSFSQAAWIALAVGALYVVAERILTAKFRKLSALTTTALLFLIPLMINYVSHFSFIPSLSVRSFLSLAVFSDPANLLWGTGWYRGIPYIMTLSVPAGLVSQYWQPVHNIWLLFFLELGIPLTLLSILSWSWVVTRIVRLKKSQVIIGSLLLLWIVILGSLDHYLITYLL